MFLSSFKQTLSGSFKTLSPFFSPSISIFLTFHLFYDLENEKREDKEPYREENLKGYQPSQVAGGPYVFQCPDKKGEDKRAHDNPQPGSRNIVQESDLGQPHSEIHGCKRKINQPKV